MCASECEGLATPKLINVESPCVRLVVLEEKKSYPIDKGKNKGKSHDIFKGIKKFNNCKDVATAKLTHQLKSPNWQKRQHFQL